MSSCAPEIPTTEEPGTPIIVPPPQGGTTLVTSANAARNVLTARRDCDAVTALKRGLAEYLQQVMLDVEGARVQFQQVFYSWAEPEDGYTLPSAYVAADGEAEYDYHGLTPVLDPKNKVALPGGPAGQQAYLVKYAELKVSLACQIYTSSPDERAQVSMLLEDALNPVDWMYGFKLDLPHYFNQRAVYEPVTTVFTDSEDGARRRWRPGTVMLSGQVSVLRVRTLPLMQPRAVVTTLDADEPVAVQGVTPRTSPWHVGFSGGFGPP